MMLTDARRQFLQAELTDLLEQVDKVRRILRTDREESTKRRVDAVRRARRLRMLRAFGLVYRGYTGRDVGMVLGVTGAEAGSLAFRGSQMVRKRLGMRHAYERGKWLSTFRTDRVTQVHTVLDTEPRSA